MYTLLRLTVFSLLLVSQAFAAPPSRLYSYSTGDTIDSDEVTANEDSIFDYLRGGVDTYTDSSIVNADVSASAAIQSDKLSLASINQTVAFSLATLSFAKGTDVASTAAMTLGNGNFFDITGTTTITSITAKTAGTVVILQFDGALTVTDGSNLKLAGNFTTTADDILILISDGTSYFEISRSSN